MSVALMSAAAAHSEPRSLTGVDIIFAAVYWAGKLPPQHNAIAKEVFAVRLNETI